MTTAPDDYLTKHPDQSDLDGIATSLRNHLDLYARSNQFTWNSPQDKMNCLQGMSWQIRLDPDLKYQGSIWLRFAYELRLYAHVYNEMFYDTPFVRFSQMETPFVRSSGGYSTYGGPWQSLGLELQRLEIGIPWNYRQPLACYAFSFKFDTESFPLLHQNLVLEKLSSETWVPKTHRYDWKIAGLDEHDAAYKQFLKSYQK